MIVELLALNLAEAAGAGGASLTFARGPLGAAFLPRRRHKHRLFFHAAVRLS